jgi:hypothetical protein
MAISDRVEGPLHEALGTGRGFGHEQHVRLAWMYLRYADAATAEEDMCSAIRYVAHTHGRDERYHETLTRA